MPACAVLLGNPHAAGRRFVVLVLDAAGTPVKLIKVGVGDAAVTLIRREAAFLKSQPIHRLHAPALRQEYSDGGREAMALEYVPGTTPGDKDFAALAPLLESWIQPDPPCRFLELPAAQRLQAAAAAHPACAKILSCLTEVRLRPAVFHGDFTPWNVRVHPATRQWTVLDWERGESLGPPTWDWFHFVIQQEILVRHTRPAAVLRQLNALLHGSDFGRYSRHAGLGESATALLAAYLAYACFVVRQAEGQHELEALLDLQLSEMRHCLR
ncbi:MAG: phosphotransferase [Verrucomicrobiae bacterium]|nr:phosphotransferase [Verrucomicrobiae bacterium]